MGRSKKITTKDLLTKTDSKSNVAKPSPSVLKKEFELWYDTGTVYMENNTIGMCTHTGSHTIKDSDLRTELSKRCANTAKIGYSLKNLEHRSTSFQDSIARILRERFDWTDIENCQLGEVRSKSIRLNSLYYRIHSYLDLIYLCRPILEKGIVALDKPVVYVQKELF